MQTLCATSRYPKQRHLWDFSEKRSHTSANTRSLWKRQAYYVWTHIQSCRRTKSRRHSHTCSHVYDEYWKTYRSVHAHTHMKLRLYRGIKHKNKHSRQTGGQWVTCAGRADTVSSCIHTLGLFKSLCGDFPLSVITSNIPNPHLFCSHKWRW